MDESFLGNLSPSAASLLLPTASHLRPTTGWVVILLFLSKQTRILIYSTRRCHFALSITHIDWSNHCTTNVESSSFFNAKAIHSLNARPNCTHSASSNVQSCVMWPLRLLNAQITTTSKCIIAQLIQAIQSHFHSYLTLQNTLFLIQSMPHLTPRFTRCHTISLNVSRPICIWSKCSIW